MKRGNIMLCTIHDLMTHAGIVTAINDFTYDARATRVALGVGSIKNARSTIAKPIHDFVIDILRLHRRRINAAIREYGLYDSEKLNIGMSIVLTNITDDMYKSRKSSDSTIDMPEYVWKIEAIKMLEKYVNTMQRFMVYEIRKDDEALMQRILSHMHTSNMPDVLDFRGEKIPEIYTAQAIVDHLPKSETITDADIDKSIAAITDEYKMAKSDYTLVAKETTMNLPDYIKNSPVIIVERDYKGEHERFALTPTEFYNKYGHLENISDPNRSGTTYTLKPMIHLWYKLTTIGSNEWNLFFSDMTYDLSESDITKNNPAYIRSDLMESLTGFCHPYN